MDESKKIAYVTCHNCKEKGDCSGGRQIDCFSGCIDWMEKQKQKEKAENHDGTTVS